MGLFDNLFGSKNNSEGKEEKCLPWIPLVSSEQIRDIAEGSWKRPQIIFKHSTTCGISRMDLNRFTAKYNVSEGQLNLYFLDLKSYREVSNEVSRVFDIVHESPQLLIIKEEKVVAHASHGGIVELDLDKTVSGLSF